MISKIRCFSPSCSAFRFFVIVPSPPRSTVTLPTSLKFLKFPHKDRARGFSFVVTRPPQPNELYVG